jgi:nucleoside-diphosphate-sugar epimerase
MSESDQAMRNQDQTAVVLGAGGLLATPVTARLAADGYRVQVLGRHRPAGLPTDHPQISWRRFDALSPGSWVPPTGAVVISLLPIWLLGRLVPRMEHARFLVAFSSTSATAYRDSPDPAERQLAVRLQQAEQTVAMQASQLGLAFSILRPTMIYGGGAESGLSAIGCWIDRFGVFPVAAPANGLRQPVHAGDLAAAAVAVVDCPAAIGQTFALGGGEIIRYRQMVERLIEQTGRRGRVVALPAPVLRLGYATLGKMLNKIGSAGAIERMNAHQTFPIEPARQAFGYAPRPFRLAPADIPPRAEPAGSKARRAWRSGVFWRRLVQ